MIYSFNRNKRLLALLLGIVFLIAAGSALSLPVSAAEAGQVSPALNILANSLSLTKTCVVGSEIDFSASDFDEALGVSKLEAVTVVSLPPKDDGVLMLGNVEVLKNQTISRKNMALLRFVPSEAAQTAASGSYAAASSFIFKAAGDAEPYEVGCTLYVLSELNFAPTAAGVSDGKQTIKTLRDVALYGTFRAGDPEGDGLHYVIIKYPSKGLLSFTNSAFGSYVYTPKANYTGSDSFTYAVYDIYGNKSDEIKVSVKISKPSTALVYDDMAGHWAAYAALRLAGEGVMVGETIGGKTLFNPDKAVTRAEFLAMAMNAAGIKPASNVTSTGFADDSNISAQYKGYVAAAAEAGMISGVATDAGSFFYPNYQITRAEAAVILASVLGDKAVIAGSQSAVKTVFADQSAIPAWADDAIEVLCSLGVMNGNESGELAPSAGLTRAQTACMLSSVMDITG